MSAMSAAPAMSGPGCERRIIARPADNLLAYAYLRFEREGLLPLIFPEEVPSISWFLGRYQDKDMLTLAAVDGQGGLQGLGWVSHLTAMGAAGRYRKAECGMAFFRGTRGAAAYAG